MTAISHIGFIVAAYGLTALVILVMIASILWDYRALRAALARLEAGRSESDAP